MAADSHRYILRNSGANEISNSTPAKVMKYPTTILPRYFASWAALLCTLTFTPRTNHGAQTGRHTRGLPGFTEFANGRALAVESVSGHRDARGILHGAGLSAAFAEFNQLATANDGARFSRLGVYSPKPDRVVRYA